jgi:hypothetical protein
VGTDFAFIHFPASNAATEPRPDSRLRAAGQC